MGSPSTHMVASYRKMIILLLFSLLSFVCLITDFVLIDS